MLPREACAAYIARMRLGDAELAPVIAVAHLIFSD
jgi:hypothetical protein